jgi:hypothetical protein
MQQVLIENENKQLLSARWVDLNEFDDDEMHIRLHTEAELNDGPNATQQGRAYLNAHKMAHEMRRHGGPFPVSQRSEGF